MSNSYTRVLSIFICSFAFFSQSLSAELIKLIPEKSTVLFHAIGNPSFLKVDGFANQLQGEFTIEKNMVKGTARIALENFDTGINLRNTHMKEKYLEVKSYPEAKFILESLKIPQALSSEKQSLDFKGKLTLRNKDKDIQGRVELVKKDSEISIRAEFKCKISDFNIKEPGYKGITVADEVEVTVEAIGK